MLLRRKQSLTRLSKNNKGVTLVEVIAVIAVLGVVMAAVTGFMITGAKMSAKVSGDAKLGIREQTAVEYINERILEATTISIGDPEPTPINIGSEEYPIYVYTDLFVGEEKIVITTEEPNATNPKVVYNGVELCEGEVYFQYDAGTNTVTYYLNGTRHVVHLRVGS